MPNSFTGTELYSFAYVLPMAAFLIQKLNWVAMISSIHITLLCDLLSLGMH